MSSIKFLSTSSHQGFRLLKKTIQKKMGKIRLIFWGISKKVLQIETKKDVQKIAKISALEKEILETHLFHAFNF